MEKKLSIVLTKKFNCEGILINLRRKFGGAVAETWEFDWLCNSRKYELILRFSRKEDQRNPLGINREIEARVQQAANDNGVPTPKVRFIIDGSEGLGTGFIMDRIDGETIPRKILRDRSYANARAKMTLQCGRILSQIHSIKKSALPPLEELSPLSQIHRYRKKFDFMGENRPVFELGFNWLENNAPDVPEYCLVHGDFRNGNFIVGQDGIRSVLDWELCHWGDAMEDLGWLCVNSWRFGNIDKPVGGFGHRESLYSAYEENGGRKVDRNAIHFWEVFGTLKWGIICLELAFLHIKGIKRSIELITIGCRVSESELDLLDLIT